MLRLEESKNEDLILSFLKSEKVKEMCGYDPAHPVDPSTVIRKNGNVFLIAYQENSPVGFIGLFPVEPYSYSIHLCLRTIGESTKRLVAMAFTYAEYFLNARVIHAVYEKTARAVDALCNHFGFENASTKGVAPEVIERYNFRVLVLTH